MATDNPTPFSVSRQAKRGGTHTLGAIKPSMVGGTAIGAVPGMVRPAPAPAPSPAAPAHADSPNAQAEVPVEALTSDASQAPAADTKPAAAPTPAPGARVGSPFAFAPRAPAAAKAAPKQPAPAKPAEHVEQAKQAEQAISQDQDPVDAPHGGQLEKAALSAESAVQAESGAAQPKKPPLSPFQRAALGTPPKPDPKPVLSQGTAEVTREYAGGGFDRFMDSPDQTLASQTARKDVAAVKLVTILVAGISHDPGSAATTAQKGKALREQLVLVHEQARRLAAQVNPGSPCSAWAIGQCSEHIAGMVAGRSGQLDPDALADQVDLVGRVIGASCVDEDLAAALDAYKEVKYLEADTPDKAEARILVSLSTAVWEVHAAINKLRHEGEAFTWGQGAEKLVTALSSDLLKSANSASIKLNNADLQVAHVQGSLRRLALLISEEHTALARNELRWVKAAASPELRAARLAEICTPEHLADIASKVQKTALENFLAIEHVAPAMVKDTQTHQDQQRHSPR